MLEKQHQQQNKQQKNHSTNTQLSKNPVKKRSPSTLTANKNINETIITHTEKINLYESSWPIKSRINNRCRQTLEKFPPRRKFSSKLPQRELTKVHL